MTERDPDPLYDALRDRLANYGQEPPARLWAGIRAKLPPPVAQPQLRRRRWSPALLLGLLLAVAGAAGWQWWRPAGQGPAASGAPQRATGNPNAANDGLHARLSAAQPSAAATASPAQSGIKTAETSRSNAVPMAASSAAVATSPAAVSAGAVAANAAVVASANSRPQSQKLIRARTRRLVGSESARRASTSQARRAVLAFQGGRASRLAAAAATRGVGNVTGASSSRNATALSDRADAVISLAPGTQAGAVTPQGNPAAAGVPALDLPAAAASASPAKAPAAGQVGRLEPRAAALAAPPYSEPVVRARADSARALPAAAARRWAALVLAGPAVTYRALGNGNNFDNVSPLPPNTATPTGFSLRDAKQRALEENPAVGFGLQVQVRRVLTGRWGLSTGLGYQEYALQAITTSTADARNLPGAGSSIPTPSAPVVSPVLTEAKHRDTYRFLSVPVRVSYALGHPAGRFRYGLLAGLDAALYLGGSSPAANGQTTTWDASGSPHRFLSASVSAGLDLRYRLAPRWDLVAQPTATYFLNALPRPASGLTPRHLLGTGAQVGVSYDFR